MLGSVKDIIGDYHLMTESDRTTRNVVQFLQRGREKYVNLKQCFACR